MVRSINLHALSERTHVPIVLQDVRNALKAHARGDEPGLTGGVPILLDEEPEELEELAQLADQKARQALHSRNGGTRGSDVIELGAADTQYACAGS